MKRIIVAVVVAFAISGCVSAERVNRRAVEIEAAAAAEGKTISPEEAKATALSQVTAEAAAERAEAAKKAGDVASDALTGNWVAAGVGLLGLIGLGVGAYKKAKGA